MSIEVVTFKSLDMLFECFLLYNLVCGLNCDLLPMTCS